MQIGQHSFGAWLSPQFDDAARARLAAEAERLGYTAVWLGLGMRADNDLVLLEQVLAATREVPVATAILNVWRVDPDQVAAAYHRLAGQYGDRVVLGIGVGHPEAVTGYQKPYARLVEFADRLDAAGVPAGQVVVGALADRSLRLAGARTAGAQPYLVGPEHTKHARTVLGTGPLLAPEHKVVVETDPVRARGIGRPFVRDPYLGLRNYTDNLRRYGYTDDDLAGDGSDRLIDALVPHGTPDSIVLRLREHHVAGADHVGVQVLGESEAEALDGYRRLADALAHPFTAPG
ncbi:MAG TPA: TIGR03620 family F420-dependent LLM class oxidoreductase [Pseudonocardia sp.]|jgi:probable F420-dependent oxidoreductase